MNIYIISILIALLLLDCVLCHPITPETDLKANELVKDEVRFPNGTIVGKYAYMDGEGNPVQVKYYADDSSYGVELNSVKVVKNDIDLQTVKMQGPDSILDSSSELIESFKIPSLKKNNKEPHHKADPHATQNSDKYSLDYDVYMQTDVTGPNDDKKCNKDKIRIYNFNKDKRKIRSAFSDNYDDETKVCEQF